MKVLKRKEPVDINECNEEDNTHEMTLMEFDSEPTYYKSVILPMLSAGHEGELITWLLSMGLLRCSKRCDNVVNDSPCQGVMYWVPAKVVDIYQWQCVSCSKKCSIREASVFQEIRCRFKDGMRILCGWCKGMGTESMMKLLSIKKQFVNSAFKVATEVAEKYIKSNINKWRIGGPGVVVMIETYSEGLSKLNIDVNHRSTNYVKPILCLAEIKDYPPRFWLQLLDRYSNSSSEQILNNVNTQALQIIQEIIIPGSILVTNLNTKICSYKILQSLKHLYPVIITIEGIKRHDHMNELLDNLETIWKPCLDICEVTQNCTSMSRIQSCLINAMWRQQFGDESLETLLNQMCYNNST